MRLFTAEAGNSHGQGGLHRALPGPQRPTENTRDAAGRGYGVAAPQQSEKSLRILDVVYQALVLKNKVLLQQRSQAGRKGTSGSEIPEWLCHLDGGRTHCELV